MVQSVAVDEVSSSDRQKMAGLLSFSQGLLDARSKVQMEIKEGNLGVFPETSLSGLPGLELNCDESIWLRLKRQHETAPPEPAEHIRIFLEKVSGKTIAKPLLKPAVAVDISIDEASDLLEAGLLKTESIKKLAGDSFKVKAILHLEDCSEVQKDFDRYLEQVWSRWADTERPLRQAISLYNDLFKINSLMHVSEGAPPELVWGYGMGRWRVDNKSIDMPVIEQLLDIELERNGAIIIRPRDIAPQLSLKPYFEVGVSGVSALQSHLKNEVIKLGESDLELTPFSEAWEPILSSAASKLSSNGRHLTRSWFNESGGTIPSISEDLIIVSSFAIFARPRTNEARSLDLEKLRISVEDEQIGIPSSIIGYVQPPVDAQGSDESDWGLSNTVFEGGGINKYTEPENIGAAPSVDPSNLVDEKQKIRISFFPLPFNEEQGKIAEMIDDEHSSVICVSGPPGTGKSHSIANIISHQMATGKRVLVTARTPEAISAIREKLPESLRSLVIASVGTDRESAQQLQVAVTALSKEVVSLNIDDALSLKESLEQKIVMNEEAIKQANISLAAVARSNLSLLRWQDKEFLPIDLVEALDTGLDSYGWFTDRPTKKPPAQFDATLNRLKVNLPKFAEDIAYLDAELPSSDFLPTTKKLIDLHEAELSRKLEINSVNYGRVPTMAYDDIDTEALAWSLLDKSEACDAIISEVSTTIKDIVSRVIADQGPISRDLIQSNIDFISSFENLGKTLDVKFEVGDCSPDEFLNALSRGALGQKPVSFGLFKSSLKKAVNSVKVQGELPLSTEKWSEAVEAYRLKESRPKVLEALSNLIESGLAPPVPESSWEMAKYLVERLDELKKAIHIASELEEISKGMDFLFPYGFDVKPITEELSCKSAVFVLRGNLPTEESSESTALSNLLEVADSIHLPFAQTVKDLVNAIGVDSSDPEKIIKLRNEVTAELRRLDGIKLELGGLSRDLSDLEQFGVLEWVKNLKAEPEKAEELIPDDWRNAWLWARKKQQVDDIIELGNGDIYRKNKSEEVAQRDKSLEKLIRIRTLLGLKNRMTPSVLQAMESFTQAISKIGTGKGKKAPRFIREAQKAAKQASAAVPVWIMPEYKIPEQLPPELGNFDLVILDEASQSDITSLAALARGKKILVVGDEEQVSPSNVGIPDQKINALRAEYLGELSGAGLIDENTSIFEVTKRMYPQSHMMLREHFRCVAPIIQFSTRFYNNALIPLRVPTASQRFDPPLCDVYIDNSKRKGKTNEAEARWIVDEIARLIGDPAHDERDFGVISLLGGEQADLIGRMLVEDLRVGPEKIESRKIICGDARTMQGQERSVVFLSMVVSPGMVQSQSDKSALQRVNVAMSRAKDRLYLVRSVSANELKIKDIKSDILAHFANPMPDGRAFSATEVGDLMGLCDSGFEKEVLGFLLGLNYRVRPQVSVGSFSIDLVVEGNNDRRLAVELDGDLYHGPEVWDRDMARQAALERAGWVFWRVFGSQWKNDTDFWKADLIKTLERLRIEPIGATVIDERLTESIVVDASSRHELTAVA